MKYKQGNEKLIVYVITYGSKSKRSPLPPPPPKEAQPPLKGTPLKIFKKLIPTSKFCSLSKFQGIL